MARDELKTLRAEFDLLRRRLEHTRDSQERRLILEQVVTVLDDVNMLIRMEVGRIDAAWQAPTFRLPGDS